MDSNTPYTPQEYPPQPGYQQQPGMYPSQSGYMPPIQQYQVGFGEAIARGFSNYVNFIGRASRSEFWWWYLFYFLVILVPYILMIIGMLSVPSNSSYNDPTGLVYTDTGISRGLQSGIGLIGAVFYLIINIGLFLPTLSLVWRRLHDTNRSGSWMLLTLIPFVNIVTGILLIMWYCQPSKPFTNEYGPVPNLKTP